MKFYKKVMCSIIAFVNNINSSKGRGVLRAFWVAECILLVSWLCASFVNAEVIKLIDDFEDRKWANKLGGTTGPWEKYANDTEEYCKAVFLNDTFAGHSTVVLRLLYSAPFLNYNGYFSNLNSIDLRPYEGITFLAKGGPQFVPVPFKLEISNNYHRMFYYTENLTREWQRYTIPFKEFEKYGQLEDWNKATALVIVFEGRKIHPSAGDLIIDDIALYASDAYYEKMTGILANDKLEKQKEFERIASLPDDKLIDYIEQKTFDYFWFSVDPATNLVDDRSILDSAASTGATGFGLTALCIGAERKWITKKQAEKRVLKTLQTLKINVEGHKGFFYHWVRPATGVRDGTSELSSVDTALLLGGVLTVREYFSNREIKKLADEIYLAVDWQWLIGPDPDKGTLLMGWDPETGFDKYIRWDMFAEETMMYLLALGSPTHPLPAQSWNAFARPVKDYKGNKYMYHDGESMFVYTYSHAWVDYRDKHDQYADYWKNSQAAIRSNYEFCKNNSDKFKTYAEGFWGISASDGPKSYSGYGAVFGMHDGTIPPYSLCAAVPFTPDIALPAIRKLFAKYGTRVWDRYGFVSAFNIDQDWFSSSHIGIDEGIILLMLENYRTGFVWKYFMKNPYIQEGMNKAGFKNGSKQMDFAYMEELQKKYYKEEEVKKIPIKPLRPTIDGDLSEWKDRMISYDLKKDVESGVIKSSGDLDGQFGMAWDENYIYFAANVTDDVIMANEKPAEIYKGDGIELYLDVKTKGKNFLWGDKEYFQIGLAPKCALERPIAWPWFQGGEKPEEIKIASKRTNTGYTLEVSVKAEFLNIKPRAGVELGLSPALHDLDKADEADKKLNWCFKKSAGKIILGTAVLEDLQ